MRRLQVKSAIELQVLAMQCTAAVMPVKRKSLANAASHLISMLSSL